MCCFINCIRTKFVLKNLVYTTTRMPLFGEDILVLLRFE